MDEKEAEARPVMGTIFLVYTRKMVPITGRARSFLLVFKNKIERRGDRIKTAGLSIYPML